jgi:putative transposon-encoded protein
MTLKVLRWNGLGIKPDQIQSDLETAISALQPVGKIKWQFETTGYYLWCFLSVDGEITEVHIPGEEMIEKEVKRAGNSGRVYVPRRWLGKRVKIIRID